MDILENNSANNVCDLCEVIYTAAKDHGFKSHDGIQQISLVRSDDDFVLEGSEQRFLRLIETMQDTTVPLATPELASLTSNRDPSPADLDSFMKLPRACLEECNTSHQDVCAPKDTHILPTRLINVANLKKPKIVATADLSQAILSGGIRYIAVSHRWGDMPYLTITTQNNLEQRQKKIPMDELPLSFRNAIAITSALGCTYLWIDSLCITQGPDGDFSEEADKMQTIFNGAYCVLAACNAESAKVGSLENRESPSNASRSTYWECGEGIRCKTLAKLKNDKIAFLSDPNFPDYTIRPSSTIGDQIKLFIDLFQRRFRRGTRSRRAPPTWSWVAFDGAISFIEPGGGQVSWNDAGVKLPFANLTGDQTSWLRKSCQDGSVAIQAKVPYFNIPEKANRSEACIYYDDTTIRAAKCVIVGTDKYHGNDASLKKHYALIVKPLSHSLGGTSYERCGVGYMPGKYIRLGNPSVYMPIE
ncbi:hypothetical protein BCIN_04g03480 [Botrytis cinerea B05.10]|uniref:Heterokaryon incompatibility domain-containing protein n=1 Tax=Botryotinia fuckeliana (strain B05.10) TaxID=332648 RepID=A0A384JEX6_BOTFB|nr:hypothetical protein BCIN_04g03480 [Botrytis cinerea B05.10]ATZ49165.1 hypothetical protein BCIN_04g03480 [Botrytis cinerea B05.10]